MEFSSVWLLDMPQYLSDSSLPSLFPTPKTDKKI